jgi:hypothetical protein
MAEAPDWLASLVDTVANYMEPHAASGPLAFRWGEEEGFWEMIVYCTPGELVGGAEDGEIIVPGFTLDVRELMSAFEKLRDVRWYSHLLGPQDKVGRHIVLDGVYQGHEVYSQVLAEAPDDAEPGFKVNG